ncbi:MAG: ATP-binding protein [Actinomycetota bacterium]
MKNSDTRAYPALTRQARVFMWAVVIGVLLGFGLTVFRHPDQVLQLKLAAWIVVVAAVELLPVPVSQVLRFSVGFSILLGIAILYTPSAAAIVALLGSSDPRELKREIPIPKALYNRTQIAVSTLAASAVFHSLASSDSPIYILLPVAFLAAAANYLTNVSLVLIATRLIHGLPMKKLIAQFRVGALSEFLLSYIGLGFVGVGIAKLYLAIDLFWSVAAFILPLVFARQMFFRNLALEEATKELKDRERVLRALSNRMAEERQDERMQIAAYLHDDLAQMLFRMTLQVEMAKKRLLQGENDAVLKDLEGIRATKQDTSDAIRALIRDLHRSPIGRKGLAEAIQSFAGDMTRGHPTRVESKVVEVSLPPPIQLLIYQIVREATMNALKHAEASTIRISLEEVDEGVKLDIADDGKGFDTSAPPPEGHFGSVMMRERAMVAGGTYTIESEIDAGTTITVVFPRVWVEEGSRLEADSDVGEGDGKRPSIPRPPVGSTVGPPRPSRPERDGDATDDRWGAPETPEASEESEESEADSPKQPAVDPSAAGAGNDAPKGTGRQPAWPDRERPAVPA